MGKMYFVKVFLNLRNYRGLRNVLSLLSCPNEGMCSKSMLGFVFCFTSTSLSSPFLNVNTSLNANILLTVPLINIKEI